MSSYRPLLDLTSETLIKRTKCYRRLVVSVVLIGLGSIITAIVTLNMLPLTGLLLFIPAYSYFLLCDNSKLNHWRNRIMNAWKSKAIDLSALSQAITANKTLPPDTIQGMLQTLPKAGDLVAEQSVAKSTRQALSTVILARDNLLHQKMFCRAILSTIIVVTIVSAVIFKSWLPLPAIAISPTFLIVCISLNRKIVIKAKSKIASYAKIKYFDLSKYNEIFELIDWLGIPSDCKRQLSIINQWGQTRLIFKAL